MSDMKPRLQIAGIQRAKALQNDGLSANCRRKSHGSCAVLRCRCSCHGPQPSQPISRCRASGKETSWRK